MATCGCRQTKEPYCSASKHGNTPVMPGTTLYPLVPRCHPPEPPSKPSNTCSADSASHTSALQLATPVFTFKHFMLVPAGDLPGRPSKCSLAWQRGAKLQYTAAAFVDGQEHVVYWDETLKQVRGIPLRAQSLGSFLMDVYCWGCCWIPVRLRGLHGRQLCDISSVLPATKSFRRTHSAGSSLLILLGCMVGDQAVWRPQVWQNNCCINHKRVHNKAQLTCSP